MRHAIAIGLLALTFAPASSTSPPDNGTFTADDQRKYDPMELYTEHHIEGWLVGDTTQTPNKD